MDTEKSNQLYSRAKEIIPGGTQTVSKRPEVYVPGKWPAYWDRGRGSHIWDIDGNEYIDYVMALGPIVLGYCHPAVDEAIAAQLRNGTVASFGSPLEVHVAEKLIEHVPCAEMVRFFKTGAEATAAAVRIVRAYTGREKVISSGYHGWLDWCRAKNRERGVPESLYELIFDVKYGDSGTLEMVAAEHGDDTACIIVDPVQTAADADFLRLARELADRHGALLVFDEIITGFRLGLGGAQGYFGVIPDVATFGKAMANGMPLSAVVGKREVMQQAADLWISSTFGGEALSLAAAKATIQELERPEALEQLWAKGRRLMDGWRETVAGNGRVQVDGLPPIPALLFTDDSGGYDAEADGIYVERMFDAGILMRREHYAFVTVSLSDDDIDRTIEATEGAIGAAATVK